MSGSLEEDALGWNLGRYTLHGEIASGGMATVHIGRMVGSAGFTKMVAIKRLHAQFANDPDFVAMFLDEARLAARVHHPNVVQPLDVIATDGEVFLVMEYVRGESLAQIQRILRPEGRRIPTKIVGAIMVGVLHGLHAAHEAKSERGMPLGIVHRDVSPQNVMVGTDGTARVLDFGIAKASDRAHSTREGDLKGKLAYMSPEQLTGEVSLDRRTDVFAASIVLWELLTGQRLYESDDRSNIVARTRGDAVKAPSEFSNEVGPELDQVVIKALSRDPAQRFATAREMAIALEMYMPLATPSKVGEWLEEVAADSLVRRAARIAEIEQEREPASVKEVARAIIHEMRKTRPSVPRALEDSAILVEPARSISEVHRRETPTPPFRIASQDREDGPTTSSPGPRTPASAAPATTAPLGFGPIADATDTMPRDAGRPKAGMHVQAKRTSRILTVLIFAVLGLGVLVLLLPLFVKRVYVHAAAKRGIVLAVDSVELSLRKVRLVGSVATFPEMPGIVVRMKALDFAIAKDAPATLLIVEPEIAVDGPLVPMHDALNLYLATHPLKEVTSDHPIDRIAIERGRLVWMRAFGEKTRLALEGIHGQTARTNERALGEDYAMATDSIAIGTLMGELGPWRGTLTRSAASIIANVTLSTDEAKPATLTYIDQEDGLGNLEVKIPRSASEKVGIPRGMLGDEPLYLEGSLRGVSDGEGKLEIESAFALEGVRVADASRPVDVRFQARVMGDRNAPMAIDGGVMTLGAFRARLWGKGSFAHDGFRIDGAWKSAPRSCLLERDPGPEISIPELAADAAGLDRAIAAPTLPLQSTIGGVFVFDSRDLGQTRITAVPSNQCSRLTP